MSRIRTRAASLALLVALGSVDGSAQDAPIPAKWAWRVGQTRRFEFRQASVARPRPEGQATTVKTRTEVVFTLTARSVAADGSADLALGIETVKADVESGPFRSSFDSAKPAANPADARVLEAIYRPAIGGQTLLKMEPNGRVHDVRVPETVRTAVTISPFAATEDVMGLLTPSGITSLFSTLSPTLPDPPLRPDASRDRTIEPQITPAPLRLELIDRVKEDEDSRVVFEVKGRVSSPPRASSGGVGITVTESSVTGEVSFGKGEGHLDRSTLRQRLTLRLTVDGTAIVQEVEVDHTLASVGEASKSGSGR